MVFPGGNTCQGFYSFYHHIIGADAARIFILKGGPGVGKSTFMKILAQEFLSMGHNIEYHRCSSDNSSLDGVVIKDLNIALIDGTAPHIVDPRNPGAVDEIINLGEYWHEPGLIRDRNEIINLNRSVGKCFRLAYQRLKEAHCIWQEQAECYGDLIDDSTWTHVFRQIVLEICPGLSFSAGEVRHRHLFAAAITPDGAMTHLDTLLDPDFTVLALHGLPGTGLHRVLAALEEWAICSGVSAEIYHNCLDPSLLDVMIFREAGVVILDASGLIVNYEPVLSKMSQGKVYHLGSDISTAALRPFAPQMQNAQDRFIAAMDGAVGYIKQAKIYHDEMETYYIPAMDFSRINQKRDEIRDRILEYQG
jgi:hypothetical protein